MHFHTDGVYWNDRSKVYHIMPTHKTLSWAIYEVVLQLPSFNANT